MSNKQSFNKAITRASNIVISISQCVDHNNPAYVYAVEELAMRAGAHFGAGRRDWSINLAPRQQDEGRIVAHMQVPFYLAHEVQRWLEQQASGWQAKDTLFYVPQPVDLKVEMRGMVRDIAPERVQPRRVGPKR